MSERLERQISPEATRPKDSIGLVLTSGIEKSQIDGLWIPSAEGRIRVQAALIDLRQGIIDKVYVCGGRKEGGLEEGDYYYFYAKNILARTDQDQNKVGMLEGGYETGSD